MIVSLTFNYGKFRFKPSRIHGVSNVKIIFMNLSEGETGREVYTLPTPIRVNLRIKVMFLIRIMPETCRRRLII